MRRGWDSAGYLLIFVGLIVVVWAVSGLAWWILLAGVVYFVADIAISEFWFRRLRYLNIDSQGLSIPLHWWGGVIRLVWPMKGERRIPYSRINSISPARGDRIRIDHWAPDSGGRLLHEETTHLRPVSPQAVMEALKRRAPESVQFAQTSTLPASS